MAPRDPRRRWPRRVGLGGAGAAVAYAAAVLLGMPVAAPYDLATNLGDVARDEALVAPADGRRRVVVLQHGILRSPLALGRLERALVAHGYEVHNLGYPSTAGSIAEHAERLAAAVVRIVGDGPPPELAFVGHSMGGLVIQEYLRRADARTPSLCIYIATPHRGALLADLRKHWFPFRWVMGHEAAFELSPSAPLHRQPIPHLDRSAVVVGDLGPCHDAVPGPDDGTVAVHEAGLPGAAANFVVPVGHTAISRDPAVIRRILGWLRHGLLRPG